MYRKYIFTKVIKDFIRKVIKFLDAIKRTVTEAFWLSAQQIVCVVYKFCFHLKLINFFSIKIYRNNFNKTLK